MLKSLSYSKKNKYLWIIATIFTIICYNFTLKKTIALVEEVSSLNKVISLAKNASENRENLQQQLRSIENQIGNSQNDSINIQQSILNLVTNYCFKNDLVLQEFPGALRQMEKSIVVETNYFTVRGDFIKLLRLVNLLEHHVEIGKVTSSHFQSKRNSKTQKMELTVTVYIQNFKKELS